MIRYASQPDRHVAWIGDDQQDLGTPGQWCSQTVRACRSVSAYQATRPPSTSSTARSRPAYPLHRDPRVVRIRSEWSLTSPFDPRGVRLVGRRGRPHGPARHLAGLRLHIPPHRTSRHRDGRCPTAEPTARARHGGSGHHHRVRRQAGALPRRPGCWSSPAVVTDWISQNLSLMSLGGGSSIESSGHQHDHGDGGEGFAGGR